MSLSGRDRFGKFLLPRRLVGIDGREHVPCKLTRRKLGVAERTRISVGRGGNQLARDCAKFLGETFHFAVLRFECIE
jgi:hypothetical protein